MEIVLSFPNRGALLQNFARVEKKIFNGVKLGVWSWMNSTMIIARDFAPKDTGALRESAFSMMIVGRGQGVMGFHTVYAAKQHELHRTRRKFLTRAVQFNARRLKQWAAAGILTQRTKMTDIPVRPKIGAVLALNRRALG